MRPSLLVALAALLVPSAVSHATQAQGANAADALRPTVELEAAYPSGARPRPAGDVAASQHDAELIIWNMGGSTLHPPDPNFHPAVRVMVNTRALRPLGTRGLTAAGILAQTRNRGYWPFRLCYEAALRKSGTQSRGQAVRGDTVLRFSIGTSGKVTYARRLRSELPNNAVTCLRQALQGLRFSPAPQRRVDVDLTLSLNPGDAPLLPLPREAEPSTDGGTRTFGSSVTSDFQKTVPIIQRCYRAGQKRDQKLWGRLALAVELGPDGKLGKISEKESHFKDPKVVACVLEGLEGRRLDVRPSEPRVLTVAYRLGKPD